MLAATPSPWTERNDILSVRVESDRATYGLADPIKLRITVKNISPLTVNFFNGSPWREVSIAIMGESGNPVPMTGAADTVTYHNLIGGGAREIKPGQTITLQWAGQEWSTLDHWGYSLKSAGEYSIRAVPHIVGFVATADHVSQTDRFVTGPNSGASSGIKIESPTFSVRIPSPVSTSSGMVSENGRE